MELVFSVRVDSSRSMMGGSRLIVDEMRGLPAAESAILLVVMVCLYC